LNSRVNEILQYKAIAGTMEGQFTNDAVSCIIQLSEWDNGHRFFGHLLQDTNDQRRFAGVA
jgi:hypothetical protein